MAKRHEIDDKGNWCWDCNQKDRKFSIQVTGCPTEIEVSRWAVENKWIGLSDLSVATRNKFASGKHVLTWEKFKEKALAESQRDPLAATKNKIASGKISDEEVKELMELLMKRVSG